MQASTAQIKQRKKIPLLLAWSRPTDICNCSTDFFVFRDQKLKWETMQHSTSGFCVHSLYMLALFSKKRWPQSSFHSHLFFYKPFFFSKHITVRRDFRSQMRLWVKQRTLGSRISACLHESVCHGGKLPPTTSQMLVNFVCLCSAADASHSGSFFFNAKLFSLRWNRLVNCEVSCPVCSGWRSR